MIAVSLIIILLIFAPLISQALFWLQHGEIPPRDLFWLLSDTSCYATGGAPMGWDGMDLCRTTDWVVSDWVGVNKIINWVLDVHLSAFAIAGYFAIIFALHS